MIPDDRRYTKSHEWIKVLNDDLVVVGITDHAQSELGDITFVELSEEGEAKQAGDECGEIESVKAASDVYAPIDGVIAEINSELESNPQLINQSPFDEGWLFKLKEIDQGALASLLDAAAYEQMIKEEG